MKRISIFVLLIMVCALLIPTNIAQIGIIKSSKLDVNFGDETTKNFADERSIQPTLPDIGNFVDSNITDFSSDGSKEYVGNEIVSEVSDTFKMINITIFRVEVVNDHDGSLLGAGEIFVEGTANGNYTRYPDLGNEFALNDGESQDFKALVLYSKATTVTLDFEVRDEDTADEDDSLGFVSYSTTTPQNITISQNTDTGDAKLYINVTVHPVSDITANELLNGNKPFLHIDDETGATEMPDDVLGRVIVGNDGGSSAVMMQYFYYWKTENSPDGGAYTFELHKNDFEAVYVYYDPTNFTEPYRIVINNYIYTDLDSFPNEDLLVLEKGAAAADLDYVTPVSEELQAILGINAEGSYRLKPMSALYDWEYDTLLNQRQDARRRSLMGFYTFDLTVDTSYHTFDFGPGGAQYGYNYTVTDLTDTQIHDWYVIIDDTFANGTHSWSFFGIDVPIVGPFTFDVKQVFTPPYVINGYSTVAKDAGTITKAKNSFLNVTQNLDINVGFNFPSTLDLEYPASLEPGGTDVIKLSFTPSDKVEITIGYDYLLEGNLSYWLIQSSFNHTSDGELTFDVDTATVASIAKLLGLDEYSVENVDMGDYLSLDELVITPKFFGTIITGTLSIHLWEILKGILEPAFPPYTPGIVRILDFFIDGLDLAMTFNLDGVVNIPISTNNDLINLNVTELVFTEDKLIHYVEMNVGSSIEDSSFDLVIGDMSYDLAFSIDWSLVLAWMSPLSDLINDLSWDIGTSPTYSGEVDTSAGSSYSITVDIPTTSTTPTSEPSDFPIILDLAIIASMVFVLVYRKRFGE